MLLSTAERARGINDVCLSLNLANQIRDKCDDFHDEIKDKKQDFDLKLPLNPLKGTEDLPKDVVDDIKEKANLKK